MLFLYWNFVLAALHSFLLKTQIHYAKFNVFHTVYRKSSYLFQGKLLSRVTSISLFYLVSGVVMLKTLVLILKPSAHCLLWYLLWHHYFGSHGGEGLCLGDSSESFLIEKSFHTNFLTRKLILFLPPVVPHNSLIPSQPAKLGHILKDVLRSCILHTFSYVGGSLGPV